MAGIIAFALSRAGQYLLAFAAGMALLIAAYQTGVRAERNRGIAASLRNEIAVLKRDIEIAKSSEETAKREAVNINAAGEKTRNALKVLQKRLSERPPADRCAVSAADVDLLLSIR